MLEVLGKGLLVEYLRKSTILGVYMQLKIFRGYNYRLYNQISKQNNQVCKLNSRA